MAYKDELLRELDEGFAAFKRETDGLSDAQMLQVWLGDWNTRDLLAHVAGWHREMAGALERMGRGERPTPEGVDYSDPDPWNAKFAESRSGLTPAQVRAELDDSFGVFRAAASALGEERFEPGRTVDRIIHASGIHHYQEHGKQVREWRKTL
jgi:hypothetical protein